MVGRFVPLFNFASYTLQFDIVCGISSFREAPIYDPDALYRIAFTLFDRNGTDLLDTVSIDSIKLRVQ